MTQARVQAGVPAGGQFMDKLHDDPGVILTRYATMQTNAPLERLKLSPSARQIGFIPLGAAEGYFDFDPPYQRGDVWGAVRRKNLIRSLLQGIPVPSLIINDRMRSFDDYQLDQPMYAVIDGKQRMRTVLDFYNSDLAVPASWFEPDRVESTENTDDGPYIRYSGLTKVGQRQFSNIPIGVIEGSLSSLEEEAEVFELVNFGGVPQGETDL